MFDTNQEIQEIPVHTNPAYTVFVGAGLLKHCGELLQDMPRNIAIITDDTVAALHLPTVTESLINAGFTVHPYHFPAGEENKNFHTLSAILEFMAAERMTRADGVIALGGGVIGDMAGFAAAVYMRGIRYVQIPTTMLAAVDSSVGGKTAIDLRAGKNLAGAFLQPSAVLCDTDCLKSLPADIFADGIAEAIKTGILSDESLFALFEKRGTKSAETSEIIARCVAYKAGVVERDEREQHERKLLNLGHTVGHAIEKCSNYTIQHGHAVAIGLAIISRAADRLKWSTIPISKRITDCLTVNKLPITTKFSAAELFDAAISDKKRSGNSITLVIPEKIGICSLREVPVDDLYSVIQAGLEGF